MSVIESVAIIAGADEHDEVWVSVRRTVNGSSVRHIERFKAREFTDQEDAYFVDDGLTYDSTATSTITGLDHLEAETVCVYADGARQANKTVSSGQITLDSPASTAQVGLPVQYRLQPSKLNMRDLAFIPQKNIVRLIVSLYKSLGGSYGPDASTLDNIPYTASTYDDGPTIFTGTKLLPFDGVYDESGDLLIQDDGPLPMTVRAVGVKLGVDSD
jgi:hypothetical protein